MNELELKLLVAIDKNQKNTQRDLARSLGVSLGKLNFCIKALIQKGYVKLDNFSQNPNKSGYVYLLTPKGFSEKMRLTKEFLIHKQAEYERLQLEIRYYEGLVNQYPAQDVVSPKKSLNKREI